MYLLILTILLSISSVQADPNDICDILKIPNCRGVTKQLRRTSASTIPSTSTAVSWNPANVSFDRGVGLDTIYQSGNPLVFGLSSGTGKMGGALINGSIENSFFGNRTPELDEKRLKREIENKQFRSNKLSLGIGARLSSTKTYGLDLGIILKKHPMINKVNPGVGVSARLWKFNFGASTYRDNYFIDFGHEIDSSTGVPYAVEAGRSNLQEEFNVTTYTAGTRIGNFGFDYGLIRSKLNFYTEPTQISIFSSSYHYNDFLFNLAFRKEHSFAPVVVVDRLARQVDKSEMFAAVQYSVNSHIILGLNYNYFLLREVSVSATLFL